MKKILLPFAFLSILALPTLAQTPTTPPPPPPPPTAPAPAPAPATTTAAPAAAPAPASEGGVRLGINFSPDYAWLNSDTKDVEEDGTKIGYTFGLVVEVPFGPKGAYAFRTGVGMSSIGGKFKSDYTNTDSSAVKSSQDLTLNYLQIPLLLKLGTKTGKKMDFYGLLGGNVGFNIRARTDYTTSITAGGTTTTDTQHDYDIMDQVALLNIGMLVGAGMELHLTNGPSLFGGISYNKGLTNVPDKDAKFTVNPDKKSKLLADYVEINLGIFF